MSVGAGNRPWTAPELAARERLIELVEANPGISGEEAWRRLPDRPRDWQVWDVTTVLIDLALPRFVDSIRVDESRPRAEQPGAKQPAQLSMKTLPGSGSRWRFFPLGYASRRGSEGGRGWKSTGSQQGAT
jgi:hypothetical protein